MNGAGWCRLRWGGEVESAGDPKGVGGVVLRNATGNPGSASAGIFSHQNQE